MIKTDESMSGDGMYYYSLFGYVIESDLEFPQLMISKETKADFVIKEGRVPEYVYDQREKNVYEIGDKSSWLINPTCMLYVENGQIITYEKQEGAMEQKVRNYIMGWGMSLVGLQKGIIAMHCSVVASEKGALLISGESGTGKSTLTNLILDAGYKFMADDMTYVETDESGEVYVKPAFPYQKLCRDAALRKGYSLEELIYVNESKDKFLVPYDGEFENKAVPVKALLILRLTKDEAVSVKEMAGMNKFMGCATNQFLRHLLEEDKYKGTSGRECLRMAQGIRVFVVERPLKGDTLIEISEKVMKIVNEVL